MGLTIRRINKIEMNKTEKRIIENNEEFIEHLFGWDWDVTTKDICYKCKKNFKVSDKGNIKAYKPWMGNGRCWHKECPEDG